jgi:hypothetical protein
MNSLFLGGIMKDIKIKDAVYFPNPQAIWKEVRI